MSPKVGEEHKENKRKQILDAAVRVFIRKGFHAATMKDVVEESGLSRGGVYLYFGSTEELMLAYLEEMDRQAYADWDEWVKQAGSVWGTVEALIRQTAGEVKRDAESMTPVLYEWLITAWRNRKYASLMERRFKRSLETIAKLIREGVERGEFRPAVPPETAVRLMFSFHDGLQLDTVQLGSDLTDSEGQAEAMILCMKHLLGVTDKGEPT